MYQTLVEFFDAQMSGLTRGARGRVGDVAGVLRHLAAAALGVIAGGAYAVDANVQINEGHDLLVQTYRVKQAEKANPHAGNRFALIENVSGLPEEPFFNASESTQCRAKPYRFCRDFSQSEFRLTSLRFMVPEVRGLSPKSLSIRRNSVVANYTFR